MSATPAASVVPAHPAEDTGALMFSRLGALASSESDQPPHSSPELRASAPAAESDRLGVAGRADSSAAARHPLQLLEEHCAALAADRPDRPSRYGAGSTVHRLLGQRAIWENIATMKSVLRHIDHSVRDLRVDIREYSVALDTDIRSLKGGLASVFTLGETHQANLIGIKSDLEILDELKSGIDELSTEQDALRGEVQAISRLLMQQASRCPDGGTLRSDGLCRICPTLTILHTDNNCYHLASGPTSRAIAAIECAGMSPGGTLATMTPENRGLLYRFNAAAWIGLSKEAGKPFRWDDGTPFDFTDWPASDPSPEEDLLPEESCVLAATLPDAPSSWLHFSCVDSRFTYICQIAANSVVPIA